MDSDGSVSRWILSLTDGQASVAQELLFHQYFSRLVELAAEQLGNAWRATEDEEDVALSALGSFFLRARDGQFPDLGDRAQLWALLVHITTCKAMDQIRRQQALKRGGNGRRRGADSLKTPQEGVKIDLEELMAHEPTPEMLVQLLEECRLRIESLQEPNLQWVARLKLEGYSNIEIAQKLDVAERTVGRMLVRIRKEWAEIEP